SFSLVFIFQLTARSSPLKPHHRYALCLHLRLRYGDPCVDICSTQCPSLHLLGPRLHRQRRVHLHRRQQFILLLLSRTVVRRRLVQCQLCQIGDPRNLVRGHLRRVFGHLLPHRLGEQWLPKYSVCGGPAQR
ncbi:hypothetical protein EJ04DRAFT_575206, partial [Polyplosphaeria fusca]